jgi:hypothetical protein
LGSDFVNVIGLEEYEDAGMVKMQALNVPTWVADLQVGSS